MQTGYHGRTRWVMATKEYQKLRKEAMDCKISKIMLDDGQIIERQINQIAYYRNDSRVEIQYWESQSCTMEIIEARLVRRRRISLKHIQKRIDRAVYIAGDISQGKICSKKALCFMMAFIKWFSRKTKTPFNEVINQLMEIA